MTNIQLTDLKMRIAERQREAFVLNETSKKFSGFRLLLFKLGLW